MKPNRVMWGIVALVVLITLVISSGISNGRSQTKSEVATPTPPAPKGMDFSKYSEVDYDAAPDSLTAAQIEERKIKNNRYDTKAEVLANPPDDAERVIGYDVIPYPDAFPQSRFIIVGTINSSRAFLSNEKKGIYTEYAVTIDRILKADEARKLKTGEIISADRPGGVVRYPSGQKVLYLVDGQPLPDRTGRYLFFFGNDDPKNSNYQILNAYGLLGGQIKSLDNIKAHKEFDGKTEAEFLKLVMEKTKLARGKNDQ